MIGQPTPCPPSHAHGASSECYLRHGCRDDACRAGQADRARERRREMAYGAYTRRHVPAGPTREYLEYLGRCGMGTRAVEEASGVARATIAGIRWGRKIGDRTVPAKRVRMSTAAKLMAVEPRLELLADHALVAARGTVRRLQALQTLGWSLAQLAAELRVAETNVSRTMREARVTAAKARQVVALYDRLWDVLPPASTPTRRAMVARVKARAAAAGWVPPLGWDDIDTDPTPPAVPSARAARKAGEIDEIAVELACEGAKVRLTRAERLLALPRLHARGLYDSELADLLLVDVRTILRDREELGLEAHEWVGRDAA